MTYQHTQLAWAASAPLQSGSLSRSCELSSRRPKHSQLTPRRNPVACEPPPQIATDTPSHDADIADNAHYPHTGPSHLPARPTVPPQQPGSSDPTFLPSAPSPFMPSPMPGPKPLPVVGNALDILEFSLSDLMLKYARDHGPFVKFSILSDHLYLVSDPRALAHIHKANSRNYLDRWTPPGFEVLLYNGKLRGLVFSQGRYWMHHRQIVGSVFRSTPFLSSFVNTVRDRTRFLIESVWVPNLEKSPIVNVHQSMRMLTLDVIGSAAFGQEFGAMQAGHHPIETSLSNILRSVLDVIKSPLPLWRFMHTPGRARVQANLNRLQEIERNLIHERRRRLTSDSQNEKDLLALLLRACDSQRAGNFKDDDLIWDVHDVIFAGHETTASALAASIFLIAGSPRVLRCIQEELAQVLPDGREPEFEDLSKLRYLEMVVNEALRLYPPTALVGRIAKDKDVIAGYEVPPGANVLMSPYVMGRLESLWDNPLEFRPERFLPEQIAKRHQMTHIPFGAGPRVCLGARMAMMEVKVVLAMVLSRFRFQRTTERLVVDYDSTVSFKSGMDLTLVENV